MTMATAFRVQNKAAVNMEQSQKTLKKSRHGPRSPECRAGKRPQVHEGMLRLGCFCGNLPVCPNSYNRLLPAVASLSVAQSGSAGAIYKILGPKIQAVLSSQPSMIQ